MHSLHKHSRCYRLRHCTTFPSSFSATFLWSHNSLLSNYTNWKRVQMFAKVFGCQVAFGKIWICCAWRLHSFRCGTGWTNVWHFGRAEIKGRSFKAFANEARKQAKRATTTNAPQICIFENEKTVLLHALHVHFSFLHISQQCCSLARPDVKCFAVVGTTWTNFHSSTNQFNSRIVRMAKVHFQMKFSLSSMSSVLKFSNAGFSYNRLDLIALYMSNYDRSSTISSDLGDYTKASKFLVSKEHLWCCVVKRVKHENLILSNELVKVRANDL